MNDFSPLSGTYLDMLDLTPSSALNLAIALIELRALELADLQESLFAHALAEIASANDSYHCGLSLGTGRGLVKGLHFSQVITDREAEVLTQIIRSAAERVRK